MSLQNERRVNVKGKSSLVLKELLKEERVYANKLKIQLDERRERVSELSSQIRVLEEEKRQLNITLSRRKRSLDRLPLVKKQSYLKGKDKITEQRRQSALYFKYKILRLERKVESVQVPYKKQIEKLNFNIDKIRLSSKRKSDNLSVTKRRLREVRGRLREALKIQKVLDKRENQLESTKLKNKQLRERIYYRTKPRKRLVKTIVKTQPIPDNVKTLLKISSNENSDKRFFNLYESNLKSLKFCNDNLETVKDLNRLLLLLNIYSVDLAFKRDLKVPNFTRNLTALIKGGLVDSGANKANHRYYFCTTKGKQLVIDYKNFMSYGDSPI